MKKYKKEKNTDERFEIKQKGESLLIGLILKILICPAVVYLTDVATIDVNFASANQAVLLGLVLAVAGQVMELVLLKRGTLWFSTLVDFLAFIFIVYVGSWFLPGSYVTFVGALLTASFLAITEYLQHAWLIRTGRTKKATHRD
jgi:hypothetical protein